MQLWNGLQLPFNASFCLYVRMGEYDVHAHKHTEFTHAVVFIFFFTLSSWEKDWLAIGSCCSVYEAPPSLYCWAPRNWGWGRRMLLLAGAPLSVCRDLPGARCCPARWQLGTHPEAELGFQNGVVASPGSKRCNIYDVVWLLCQYSGWWHTK